MEDDYTVALARERQTVFEVCVTSNFQSGVVSSLADHPLPRMIEAGLNVTVNTDDPSVSRITLAHEYQLVCEELNIPFNMLHQCTIAAAQAAFLPDAERKKLVARLKKEM
jgi:adenosine deaminase